MEIINHQLINNGVVITDLPRLPRDARVRVWPVPINYQASGYFVSTDNSIPACNHGEPVFVETLVADADAVIIADQENARAKAKIERTAAVRSITVTTSLGNTFDGDETSQNRMARAILGLQAAGVATITWTLADNTTADVAVAELSEALALAGAAQASLWGL